MPSPPANDQAIRLSRRVALWMVGPIVLLLRGPLAELAPPARCAGALDLISIVAVRVWPELRLGPLFSTLHAIAITLAFGCFAELADRASGSSMIALALTITLGVSQLFGVALAPPWTATAFAACAVVALALRACLSEESGSPSVARRASAALILAASIVPAWTPACAVFVVLLMSGGLAGNQKRTRNFASAIALVAAVAIPLLIATAGGRLEFFSQWSTCVLPVPAASRAAFGDAIGVTGPLVLTLSLLGAYVTTLSVGLKRTASLAAFVALATVPALGGGWPSGVALAPVVVALWCLAAIGMREVLTFAPRRGIALSTTLLVAAVPLLQLSRVHERRDDVREPLGHDRASLAQMRRLLNLVPTGSTLVEEDASTDLILRAALSGGHRPAKTLAIAPLARKDVVDALTAGRVFAFPAGQRELGVRGFVIEAVTGVPGADARGIAVVSATRACVQLGRTWSDLGRIGANGRVALVADSDLARGPAVIYFSGTNDYTPGPDGWPPRTMPGFDLRMFDRDNPANAALMDAQAAEAGLRDHPLFASSHIARLTLFRTPHAPLALPIVLGPPRSLGVGKLLDDDGGKPALMMCDAPRVNVSEF